MRPAEVFGSAVRGWAKVVTMPRSELNEKRVRNLRHVFEAGADVLERHFSGNRHDGSTERALMPRR